MAVSETQEAQRQTPQQAPSQTRPAPPQPAQLQSGGVFGLTPAALTWIATLAVVVIALALSQTQSFSAQFPESISSQFPFADWVNQAEKWLQANVKEYTRAISGVVGAALEAFEAFLWFTPWPAVMLTLALLALGFGGLRLALITVIGVFLWGAFDMWDTAMSTLSLMGISVSISVFFGVIIGVACSQNDRLQRIVSPILDTMQTMPSFVYLVPAIFFFGIGGPSAALAIVIYAIPPAIRLTNLGIRQVPATTIEAARSFGATRLQTLVKVQLPLAAPSIMMGVNQTIMMALGLAVLATFIGAGGLGDEVWNALKQLRVGWSLEGGIAIVAVAIIFDRISQAISRSLGDKAGGPQHPFRLLPTRWDVVAPARWLELAIDAIWRVVSGVGSTAALLLSLAVSTPLKLVSADLAQRVGDWIARNGFLIVSIALVYAIVLIDAHLWRIGDFPRAWQFQIREPIDQAIAWLTVNHTFIAFTKGVKWLMYSYLLSPLYSFLTAVPWWYVIAAVALLAWRNVSVLFTVVVVVSMVFLGAAGLWEYSMRTLAATAVSVAICSAIGIPIGIAAAYNRTLRAVLSPILDLMQTMPAFIYLIPAIMFFGGGETTAIIATVIYAVPPLIRLTTLGLVQVPVEMDEVSKSFGSTSLQSLAKVKLPMAIPSVMLGVNQAVVMALAMQTITPLVGGLGLGKEVFDAMNTSNTGKGLAAGIGISLMAIVLDRMSQAWTRRQRKALGLL